MKAEKDIIWLKASIIGSLWAGNEIIVGSFLHNMRLPFSGTILSVVSVALMVGFLQVWKDKGIIIRAGLICALMKSISPSAIIIGPMTGILTEAVLMEGFILLAGRNILGYLLGGIAGVLSALIHKAITLIIIYGLDFVRVLENLYLFAARQLSLENLPPLEALLILCVIYATAGIIAVITGIYAGKKSANFKVEMPYKTEKSGSLPAFIHDNKEQHNNVLIIVFIFIAMVFSLLMLNGSLFYLGIIISVAYSAFLVHIYKRSMRYLKKPMFWIQILVLVLASSIFWKGLNTGNPFDREGLLAGIKMMIRAIVIVTGFAAISVEMRSPVVKELLFKRGFSNLYGSLQMAFSILPDVVYGPVKPRDFLFKPVIALAKVISQGEKLLNRKLDAGDMNLFILTGEVNEGKTTVLKSLIKELKQEEISAGGILSLKHYDDERFDGYDLLDIANDNEYPLCRINAKQGSIKQGRYYFDKEITDLGNKIILDAFKKSDVIFIDEVGPLELSGKGWAPALDVLTGTKATMVWVVRKGIVNKVIRRWGIVDYTLINVHDFHPVDFIKSIR